MTKKKIALRFFEAVVILYLTLIGLYYLTGGLKITEPFFLDTTEVGNLWLIMIVALFLRLTFSLRKVHLFWMFLGAIGLSLALVAGEVALRIVYFGTEGTISGGPGGKALRRTFNPEGARFPEVRGPKKEGITRIFITGDSITWGAVKEWTDVYPYLLLEKLNADKKRYDMAVRARAGVEIFGHARAAKKMIPTLMPDIVIYQWFLNDLEISKDNRPYHWIHKAKNSLPSWILRHSYLVHILVKTLPRLLPSSDRSYAKYLLEDYADGTKGWYDFRYYYHNWANISGAYANRVMVMLYPALPYQGEYPLAPIHNQIRKASGPHDWSWQAVWQGKIEGDDEKGTKGARSSYVRVIRAKDHTKGDVLLGPYLTMAKGSYRVIFRMRREGGEPGADLALLDVTAEKGGVTLSEKKVAVNDVGEEWTDVAVDFTVTDRYVEQTEFRVRFLGGADLFIDTVTLPVDYKVEVVELLPYLNYFDTHASRFDAHPNERAYRAMTGALYDQISGQPGKSAGSY